MGQAAVAHQDAHAASGEIGFVLLGDAVDHQRQGDRVVLAPPAGAADFTSRRHGLVDVGVLVGLVLALIQAGAQEEAEVVGDQAALH